MSTVLDIDSLLESPLADLHAIAGELDIEGYRLLRKADLTVAILESRGAIGDEIRPAVEAKASELDRARAERERELAEREEREQAEREAAREAAREQSEAERGGDRRPRGGRGGRGGQRGGRGGQRGGRTGRERGEGRTERAQREDGTERAQREDGTERAQGGSRTERARGEGRGSERGDKGRGGRDAAERPEKQRPAEPTTPLAGVFEPGSGGGGRLRTDLTGRVRGDADVPRGEVRRWSLQRGDLINAQVRKARRGRTDFVVASIDDVNGQPQDARKQPAPAFEERAAAAVGNHYAKRLFKHAPVGAGSRLVVTGPTRASASEMLGKLAGEIVGSGVVTTLVIVSARPEQATSIAGVELIAGDATKSPESVLPALELALDRNKRLAEGGRETALLVDGLDLLPADRAAEIFNSARNLAEGGALTVAAACGAGSQLEALASSIGVVAGGRRLKLDKKASWTV
jgi:transcription termination factor Rho